MLHITRLRREKSLSSMTVDVTINVIVTVYYFQRLLSVVSEHARIEELRRRGTATQSGATRTSQHIVIPSSSEQGEGRTSTTKSAGNTRKSKVLVSVDEDLIDIITKSTFLNLMGMLSSCVVIGYLVYLMSTDTINLYMSGALRCLDGMVNTFCVFLVFRFAAPYYDIGCKCCHFGMRRCCKRLAMKMVIRRLPHSQTTIITL